MKIEITLAQREVGSTAVVYKRKLFGLLPPERKTYACIGHHPIAGAYWCEAGTGRPISPALESKLSLAAQAEAQKQAWLRLRGLL